MDDVHLPVEPAAHAEEDCRRLERRARREAGMNSQRSTSLCFRRSSSWMYLPAHQSRSHGPKRRLGALVGAHGGLPVRSTRFEGVGSFRVPALFFQGLAAGVCGECTTRLHDLRRQEDST